MFSIIRNLETCCENVQKPKQWLPTWLRLDSIGVVRRDRIAFDSETSGSGSVSRKRQKIKVSR